MVGIDDGDAVVGGVVDMDDEIEFRILSELCKSRMSRYWTLA